MIMKKNLKANVSLTTVLIITTLLLLGGIAVVFTTMDLATSTKSSNNKIINDLQAQSCIEEGLYKLRNNSAFIGQVTVPFVNGVCVVNISVDAQNANQRVFSITSTSNEYQYDIIKHIDISQNPFVIID